MATPPQVCVLGAGVIGLSSAVAIIDRLPAAQVTIIADKFTTETTSDGAFGIWEPYLLGTTSAADIRRWGRVTLQRMQALAHSEEASNAGCFTLSGCSIYTKYTEDPIWKDIVPTFRYLKKEELAAYGSQYRNGWFYSTAATECRFYLPWLTNKLESAGVTLVRNTINDLDEVTGMYDVVVNCTGLGSQKLFNDSDLVAIQGQVIRVHAPWVKHFLNSDDEDLYILPGADSVVLGGTGVAGCSDVIVSQFQKSRILDGCSRLMPSLKGCRVLADWVGLRPRRSRVRLEKETITCSKGMLKVVHNYGHGGSGITLHWGCALDTAKMVHESIAQSHI